MEQTGIREDDGGGGRLLGVRSGDGATLVPDARATKPKAQPLDHHPDAASAHVPQRRRVRPLVAAVRAGGELDHLLLVRAERAARAHVRREVRRARFVRVHVDRLPPRVSA